MLKDFIALNLVRERGKRGKYCRCGLLFMLQPQCGKVQRGNVLLKCILLLIILLFFKFMWKTQIIAELLIGLVELFEIFIVFIIELYLLTSDNSPMLVDVCRNRGVVAEAKSLISERLIIGNCCGKVGDANIFGKSCLLLIINVNRFERSKIIAKVPGILLLIVPTSMKIRQGRIGCH